MTLIKTNNRPSNSFNGLLDSFLNEGFFPQANFKNATKLPSVNIEETDEDFKLSLEVPGFKKDDFKVSLENDRLTISAHREDSKESENKNFTRKEFSTTNFSRSFVLGEHLVDGEKISASYDSGILAVQLPKKEEAKPQPAKVIEIK
jgi:HSP20 family protein